MTAPVSFLLLILASIVYSCKTNQPIDQDLQGMTVVTVTDFSNLDGCTFLLKTTTNEYLEPMNLDDSLKSDGIKIAISFKPSKSASICMKGKPIDIISVKAIKK